MGIPGRVAAAQSACAHRLLAAALPPSALSVRLDTFHGSCVSDPPACLIPLGLPAPPHGWICRPTWAGSGSPAGGGELPVERKEVQAGASSAILCSPPSFCFASPLFISGESRRFPSVCLSGSRLRLGLGSVKHLSRHGTEELMGAI